MSPGLEFRATRSYRATPEAVWAAWTTADALESWFAPEDLRFRTESLDARAGGGARFRLDYVPALRNTAVRAEMDAGRMPTNGSTAWSFEEFVPGVRLSIRSATVFGAQRKPSELSIRAEFRVVPGGTVVELVVHGTTDPHPAALGRANVVGQLDRLGAWLERAPP